MTTERPLVDAAVSEIGAMAMECSAPDWDGGGAEPIFPDAVVRATKLVRLSRTVSNFLNARRSPTDRSRSFGFNPATGYYPLASGHRTGSHMLG